MKNLIQKIVQKPLWQNILIGIGGMFFLLIVTQPPSRFRTKRRMILFVEIFNWFFVGGVWEVGRCVVLDCSSMLSDFKKALHGNTSDWKFLIYSFLESNF